MLLCVPTLFTGTYAQFDFDSEVTAWKRDHSIYIEPGNRTVLTEEEIFAVPPTIVKEDPRARWQVSRVVPPDCDLDLAMVNCPLILELCVARDAHDIHLVCECFRIHAHCFRDLGCTPDLIPRAERTYCFESLHCSLDLCEGQSAAVGVRPAAVVWLLMLFTFGVLLVASTSQQ